MGNTIQYYLSNVHNIIALLNLLLTFIIVSLAIHKKTFYLGFFLLISCNSVVIVLKYFFDYKIDDTIFLSLATILIAILASLKLNVSSVLRIMLILFHSVFMFVYFLGFIFYDWKIIIFLYLMMFIVLLISYYKESWWYILFLIIYIFAINIMISVTNKNLVIQILLFIGGSLYIILLASLLWIKKKFKTVYRMLFLIVISWPTLLIPLLYLNI